MLKDVNRLLLRPELSLLWSAFLPLLWPIGRNLEYEAALISSLAVQILPVLLSSPESRKKFSSLSMRYLLGVFLIALLPGSVLLMLPGCGCSSPSFLFWMFYLAFPSWVLGSIGVHLCVRYPHRGRLFYFLSLVILVLVAVGILWFFPQKRFFGLNLGFLHGPIYDTRLFMTTEGMIVRALQTATLISLLWTIRNRSKPILPALAAVSWLAYAAITPEVGHSSNHLYKVMPNEVEGSAFTLHYSQLTKPDLDRLTGEIEFHIKELREQISNPSDHVDIWLYPSQRSKKIHFGGDRTDIADVVNKGIHITLSEWPHPTLRHELVHALTAAEAYFGLGFHPNMAFTEGLAELLAPRNSTVSADAATLALIQSNRIPDPSDLLSPMFWKLSGFRAYTAAKSLLKFLEQRFGIERVLTIYNGANVSETLGVNSSTLLTEWQNFLRKSTPATNAMVAESLFRYPGVLKDWCPHTKALLSTRKLGFWDRIRLPLGTDREDYWEWRIAREPENPRTRLNHLKHYNTAKTAAEEKSLAITLIEQSKDLKYLEDAEAIIWASDLLLPDWQNANEALDIVRTSNVWDALPDWLYRSTLARHQLGDSLDWRFYLAGKKPIPDQAITPMQKYLALRANVASVSNEDLAKAIQTENLDQKFLLAQSRWIATEFERRQLWDYAAGAWQRGMEFAPRHNHLWWELQIRRCEYFSQKDPEELMP